MPTVTINLDAVIRYVGIPGAIWAIYSFLGVFTRGSTRIFKRLGKRWSYRRQLLKLGCGMSFARFDELLGPPIVQETEAVGESEARRYVQIYISKYAYVKAVGTNKDESVRAFSITVRSKWFRLPLKRLTNEQMSIHLRPLKFTELQKFGPDGKRCIIGANRFGYSESFYFGNPGNYQHYILAYNDAGPGKFIAPAGWHWFASGPLHNEAYSEDELQHEPNGPWANEFYRELRPNTIAVVNGDAQVSLIQNEQSVGVDHGRIRTIPH